MSKTIWYLTASLCLCIGIILGLVTKGELQAQTGGAVFYPVVATCGSGITYTANGFGSPTVNTAGSLCVNQ
jgi:hypothetical protein